MSDLSNQTPRTPETPAAYVRAVLAQHLADAELVWGYRLRRILAEDRPALDGYDQDVFDPAGMARWDTWRSGTTPGGT
jgi:hypothetical protein